MENKQENKTHSTSSVQACQNCKKDFTIEIEDFNFYEKIKVPPPTFCPECRFQRRVVWRNERVLYRRICNLCNKNIIAMYHESVPFPVYCRECWYGDGWDASMYARGYDFFKTFFEQYKELMNNVPRLALFQRNMINSEYSNMVGESKNVYLSVSIISSENVFHSRTIDKSMDILDCLNIKEGNNLFQNILGEKNYNSQYLLLCRNCIDSYYLIDCVNCSNCFMSYNLRNKEFYIRNQKYGKEEYFKELEKLNLKSRKSRDEIAKEFGAIKKEALYRFANMIRSENSFGNNLSNVKNCIRCFDVYNSENARYCYRAFNLKDVMDVDFGIKSELLYEYSTGADNDFNVKFSYSVGSTRDADYADFCNNCTNIFGCISLNNKENAILNKTYSKEEYDKLRRQIIEQMMKMPYVDKKGNIYKYGEFFPIELSPWAYNETLAEEINPLTKEEIEKNGYSWRDPELKDFKISLSADKTPDTIDEVNEDILQEVLGCSHEGKCDHQCNLAFRLTNYEFIFYKKHKIPIPIICPNCRYHERFKVALPLRLWHRSCMKEGCQIEFETSYAPDRPEKVYCESCYNKEIY